MSWARDEGQACSMYVARPIVFRGKTISIALAKKFLQIFPSNGSSCAQLSLTSLETISLVYIMTAVLSVCI